MVERSEIPVFRNDPIVVLILGFITCGLYLIYWNIKVALVLNKVSGKEAISPAVAIIAGCCIPVNVYFYYLCGQTLKDLGDLIGKPDLKGNATLLLILGFFLPFVAAMIVQGHINEIYEN
ncbi:MAG: DUF4234 domain-containing protein [Planctomycetota bacterium]|nr:MAG: DUF4234 domain-containing protein [Planctomycetota bacterium]